MLRKINLLFTTVIFLSISLTPSYSYSKAGLDNNDIVVGLLRTTKETYENEWAYSNNISEMFTAMGVKVVLIDYNTIVDFKTVKNEALVDAKDNINALEEIEEKKITDIVERFIQDNKINRVFIPGNYYNLDDEPYPPTFCRQLITKAIVNIVNKKKGKIHLMAVCGGLQGVMHAVGAKITKVTNIIKSKQGAEAHLISMPDPHMQNVHLHKLKVTPFSRLAKIISKNAFIDENGWHIIYIPDAHARVVSNDPQNMQKLEEMGYKIVGFSEDGIFEAIQDPFGNTFFQDHPESLVINALKESFDERDFHQERNTSTLAAIEIINDFLYRKSTDE